MPAWIGELVLQHLDAAYNLGRWLLGNEHDAADVVHDAFVRASRAAASFSGGDARAWWLAIVRNACKDRLTSRRRDAVALVRPVDDAEGDGLLPPTGPAEVEDGVDRAKRWALAVDALGRLPVEFREAVVLREIEDCSYREIAEILGVPIGTVMSRLARGRALLQKALAAPEPGE